MSDLDPARWREILAILDGLLAAPPHERPGRLDAACAGRPDLRREVQALLDEDANDGTPLDHPLGALAVEALDEAVGEEREEETYGSGERVGPFQIVRELGRGGMGSVFLAERADGQYRQQVAIKIVRGGQQGGELRRRFEQEREILASLQHPHIARLFDAGTTAEGDPYFVLEYVAGESITAFCRASSISIEQRLALFLQVCEAVRYAHRRLVVHRDLKPSNILVDADQGVKLLDFGIAKLLEADGADSPGEPSAGAGTRIMTPEYAAPEQIFGGLVTTSTDVFALGLVLCELLTGTAPRWRPAEARIGVAEAAPWPPQASALADAPSVAAKGMPRRDPDDRRQPQSQPQRLRGDLDAIVATALQVAPDNRYSSVEALAEDVRRHLEGLPIAARNAQRAYRASRFLRRHKVALAATALVFLAVAGGLVAALSQARKAEREARRATAIADFLISSLKAGRNDTDQANPGDMRVRDLLEPGVARIEADLANDDALRAELLSFLGDMDRMFVPELAQLPLERSLELFRKTHGPRHPLVARSLISLGTLALNRQEWRVAEERLAEGVAILRARPNQDLAPAIARLGDARRALGRLDEAEALERESISLVSARFGSDSPRLQLPMSRLVRVLVHQGRLGDAEAVLRAILKLTTAGEEADSLDLNTRLDLAQVLRERGEALEEATTLYAWVEERAQGNGRLVSVQRWAARTGRALVLLDKGDLPAAKALFDAAPPEARLAMRSELDDGFVPHLPEAVRSLLLDDPAAGGTALERELARLRLSLPEGHPRIAEALLLLGGARLERNDAAGAVALLEEALAARLRFFAPTSWRVAEARLSLGVCMERLGRRAEARGLLREGLGGAAARYAGHPRVQEARKILDS